MLSEVRTKTVLTNGHTGHVPRAPGFLRGFNWLWWNNFFKTIYLITFAMINCKGNPVNTFKRGAPFGWGGAQGSNAGKDATGPNSQSHGHRHPTTKSSCIATCLHTSPGRLQNASLRSKQRNSVDSKKAPDVRFERATRRLMIIWCYENRSARPTC